MKEKSLTESQREGRDETDQSGSKNMAEMWKIKKNHERIVHPSCTGYYIVYILKILGPEIWKPLLEEIRKL